MFDTRAKKILWTSIVIMLLAWPVAWAASNFYNVLFGPAEYYGAPSLFFRTTTNPAQIIPVMASDGYRLPVTGDITTTPGTSPTLIYATQTFNTSVVEAENTYPASITFTVGTETAVVCPDLGTATLINVWSSDDLNYGGTDIIGTGTGRYIPGDVPIWPVSLKTSTPALYFIGRLKTVTVVINKDN